MRTKFGAWPQGRNKNSWQCRHIASRKNMESYFSANMPFIDCCRVFVGKRREGNALRSFSFPLIPQNGARGKAGVQACKLRASC